MGGGTVWDICHCPGMPHSATLNYQAGGWLFLCYQRLVGHVESSVVVLTQTSEGFYPKTYYIHIYIKNVFITDRPLFSFLVFSS